MKELERLQGANHALCLMLLALVDSLPDEIKAKAWHSIDVAVDAGKTALLNRADCSEAELAGYEDQAGALRYAR